MMRRRYGAGSRARPPCPSLEDYLEGQPIGPCDGAGGAARPATRPGKPARVSRQASRPPRPATGTAGSAAGRVLSGDAVAFAEKTCY